MSHYRIKKPPSSLDELAALYPIQSVATSHARLLLRQSDQAIEMMIDRVHLLRRLGSKFQTRVQRPPRARALPFLEVIRLVARQQRKHLVQTRHIAPLPFTRTLGVYPHARLSRAFPHGSRAPPFSLSLVARALRTRRRRRRRRSTSPTRDARLRAIAVLGSFARARARFGSRGRVTTETARGWVVRPRRRRRRAFAPESTRKGCQRRALASERRRTTTMKRELVC